MVSGAPTTILKWIALYTFVFFVINDCICRKLGSLPNWLIQIERSSDDKAHNLEASVSVKGIGSENEHNLSFS